MSIWPKELFSIFGVTFVVGGIVVLVVFFKKGTPKLGLSLGFAIYVVTKFAPECPERLVYGNGVASVSDQDETEVSPPLDEACELRGARGGVAHPPARPHRLLELRPARPLRSAVHVLSAGIVADDVQGAVVVHHAVMLRHVPPISTK